MILLTTLKTHLLKLIIGESSLELNQVAERAKRLAKREERQAHLSYDDPEDDDSKEFSDKSGVAKVIGWCAVGIIFTIVTTLKLIEIWQR